MSRDSRRLRERLLAWLGDAVAEGWIDGAELERLELLETGNPEQLFEDGAGRPLTVGFFGGTGVGKSSLLNRLVGEPVAEVGLERPTSTGVTVYVHEAFPVADLAALFPVSRVRVRTHGVEALRAVAWIDMPDIDSVESANRELVLDWLPYIDWLVYVVSPERYRDDPGWRLLQERGHRHHWLFIMNRIDTGSAEQHADFRRLLEQEGFQGSHVLKTSCAAPAADDFARMRALIDEAVAEHGLERLKQIGERAHLQDLSALCRHYQALIGDDEAWRALDGRGRDALARALAGLEGYLRDAAAIDAASLVPERMPRGGVPQLAEPPAPALVGEHVQGLEAALTVCAQPLPVAPVRRAARAMLADLEERLTTVIHNAFREGAARPGTALQRGGAALLDKLVYGLPLAAALGVAWVAVTRYADGLRGTTDFLGLDFLTHSAVIIGLCALGPFLLSRLVRPSPRRSVLKRVAHGLQQVRGALLEQWREAAGSLRGRARELRRGLDALRRDIEQARAAHHDGKRKPKP